MKHFSRIALRFSILTAIILVLVVSFRGWRDSTADEILSQVEKTYADCKTYSDSGTTKWVLILPAGNDASEGRFTTAFIGPNQLKFDFHETLREQRLRTILWRKGEDIATWSTVTGQLKQKQELLTALSETGVYTAQSAFSIPSLLFQSELQGRLVTTMWGIERIGDAKLDETDCFRIAGKKGKRKDGSAGVIMTLWIDKTDYLIRKIDWTQSGLEITIIYEPVINGEVKEEALNFDPPQR